jgi:hypothetical protein
MARKKKDHDYNVNAFRIVQEATGSGGMPTKDDLADKGKNPHAVALGRAGGIKGGKARAAKLTPEQRKEIAKIAAAARWKKS